MTYDRSIAGAFSLPKTESLITIRIWLFWCLFMTDFRIIGIIPARIGSKRFPGKMLANVHGKTLIQRTYENARLSTKFDTLIVATDNQEIFDLVKSFGGHPVMTAVSCQNGTERAAEVIQKLPEFTDTKIVVNIQGDEPDIATTTIDRVIEALENDEEAQVSTACVRIDNVHDAQDPSVVKCVLNQKGQALYFSRSMIPHGKTGEFNSETTYYKHFGIYCYRKDFLLTYNSLSSTPLQLAEDLEQLKILEHGYSIHVVEVESDSIGIDTPKDLNKFLKSRPNI
jgi:3-deoxy-manno-octulosonate cytidylyltransferase (CMP-KDO synthetase)